MSQYGFGMYASTCSRVQRTEVDAGRTCWVFTVVSPHTFRYRSAHPRADGAPERSMSGASTTSDSWGRDSDGAEVASIILSCFDTDG